VRTGAEAAMSGSYLLGVLRVLREHRDVSRCDGPTPPPQNFTVPVVGLV
jgi:hypothetical protein